MHIHTLALVHVCVHTCLCVCVWGHSCTCVSASARGSTRRKVLKHLFSPWAFKHQKNIKTEGESQCWSWGSRACAEAVTALSLSTAGLPPDSHGQEGLFCSGYCRLLCLLGAAPPQHPLNFQETGYDVQVPWGGSVRTGHSV